VPEVTAVTVNILFVTLPVTTAVSYPVPKRCDPTYKDPVIPVTVRVVAVLAPVNEAVVSSRIT
jgi:hypothetical protein